MARIKYLERTTKDIAYVLNKKDYWGFNRATARKYGSQNYSGFCTFIFAEFMKLVVDDVIYNERVYKLPFGKNYIAVTKMRTPKINDYNVWETKHDHHRIMLLRNERSKTLNWVMDLRREYQDEIDKKAVEEGAYLKSKRIYDD